LRELPLLMRKANQKRLLRGRFDRIFVNSFKTGDIGPDLCRKACEGRLRGAGIKAFRSAVSGRPVKGLAEGRIGAIHRSPRRGSIRVDGDRHHPARGRVSDRQLRGAISGRTAGPLFYFDDFLYRRMRPDLLDSATAKEQAKVLARAEQEKLNSAMSGRVKN
jgi:hypothetical protein